MLRKSLRFLPSPALVEGTEWLIMFQPRCWLCPFVGRRNVPSDGSESCGSFYDNLNDWTDFHIACVKCVFFKSVFIKFSWVSTGCQTPCISDTRKAQRQSAQSEAGCAPELNGCNCFWGEQYLFISLWIFFSPCKQFWKRLTCFLWKKMLKQESLRTAVLIRAKVHWPNTLLQSGQPSSSKGKLMSCAGLLLPESWKCRPFMAGTGIPWSLKPHGLLPRTQGMCLSSAWALQSHLCPLLTWFFWWAWDLRTADSCSMDPSN